MYDSGQFIMISQEITGIPETGPTAFSFRGVLHFFYRHIIIDYSTVCFSHQQGPRFTKLTMELIQDLMQQLGFFGTQAVWQAPSKTLHSGDHSGI